MSDYANQFNLQIAEVVRITFNDILANGEIRGSTEIVMHCDFLKPFSDMLLKAMAEHNEVLAKQAELNRKMN